VILLGFFLGYAQKSLLVLPINPDEGSDKLARKWTELLLKGLQETSSLKIKNGWELEDDTVFSKRLQSNGFGGLRCTEVECAGALGREFGYDYVIVTRIGSRGFGYFIEHQLISAENLKQIFSVQKNFKQGKRELVENLVPGGRRLGKTLSAQLSGAVREQVPGSKRLGMDSVVLNRQDGNTQIRPRRSDSILDPTRGKTSPVDLQKYYTGTPLEGVLPDTLKLKNSPYLLVGNAVIPAEQTLVIEPGVRIYVGGDYTTIQVLGRMDARGTKENPITILSAKKDPRPWDWDRIIFRSRDRSVLEWVEISGSNYGLSVINAALSLNNVLIKNNSLRGVYVQDGEVEIKDSYLEGGHLVALQVAEYGLATLERTQVRGNHNGISVQEYGTLKIRASQITGNDRGLVLIDSVLVEMDATEISKNRIGVLSNVPLSKRLFDGLRRNTLEISVLSRERMSGILEKPPLPREERAIQRVSTEIPSQSSRSFRGGILSSKDPGALQGLLGNFTLASEYHLPWTPRHLAWQPLIMDKDTLMRDDRYPQDKVIPGYYQNISSYLSYENGSIHIEANNQIQWDVWGRTQMPLLGLQGRYKGYRMYLGDFTENSSELGAYSLQLRGAKAALGWGGSQEYSDRWLVEGAMGESEKPYDEGQKVLGSYQERKSEGTAVPQKIVKLANLGIQPFPFWQIYMRTLWSEDKRETWLRPDISEYSTTAQPELKSRQLTLDQEWKNRNQTWSLQWEISAGTVDSTDAAYNRALKKILLQKYSEAEAALLAPLVAPKVKTSFVRENIALATQAEVTTQDSINLQDSLIQAGIQTGLEDSLNNRLFERRLQIIQDLRAATKIQEKEEQKNLEENRVGSFNWDNQGLASRVKLSRIWNNGSMEMTYLYIGKDFFTGGNPYLVQNRRSYQASLTQELTEKWSLQSQYSLEIEKAGGILGEELNLSGVESVPGITQPERTHKAQIEMRAGIASQTEISLKYGTDYKTQILDYTLKSDSTRIFFDPWFAGADSQSSELRYFDNKAYWADTARLNFYRSLSGSDTVPLARIKDINEWENQLKLEMRTRLTAQTQLQTGILLRYKNDFTSYQKEQLLSQLKLQDTTLEILGWYPQGEDEWEQAFDVSFSRKSGKWNHKWTGTFKHESRALRVRREWGGSFRQQSEWEPLKRKLRMQFNVGFKWRTYTERAYRYYLQDSSGKNWYFFKSDSLGEAQGSPDGSGALAVGPTDPSILSHQIHSQRYRPSTLEQELNWECVTRYNLNSRAYLEAVLWQNSFWRPQSLDQQYNDIAAKVAVFYSL